MQVAKNFYHDNTRYKKYDKFESKDLSAVKELKAKGLIADKVEKPKVKAKKED